MKDKFEHDYKKIFEALPGHILILDAGLKIVIATKAYRELTHQTNTDIAGKYVFDVFPENNVTEQNYGLLTLSQSFDIVFSTKRTHAMPPLRYDLKLDDKDKDKDKTSFKTSWWQVVNSPILNEAGEVIYIVNAVEDITDTISPSRAGNPAT